MLTKQRFLWIKEQNRACQWPMVHINKKVFNSAGTGAVTGHRTALVSELVPYSAKTINLFCLTSEYLLVLVTSLSFSWISFLVLSHDIFIITNYIFQIFPELICRSTALRYLQVCLWRSVWIFPVSKHDCALLGSATPAWTAWFRRGLSYSCKEHRQSNLLLQKTV